MDEAPSRPICGCRVARTNTCSWSTGSGCLTRLRRPAFPTFRTHQLSAVAVDSLGVATAAIPSDSRNPRRRALAGWATAYAQPAAIGSAEVLAGAGHDSNMFLQITPDPAAAAPLVSGWFGRVAPALSGALAWPSWRLGLAYRLDYRGSDAAGSMLQHEGELSLAMPALEGCVPGSRERWSLRRLSLPEEGFWLAGGNLGLRIEITSALRLSAAYRLDRRSTTDGAGTLASTSC